MGTVLKKRIRTLKRPSVILVSKSGENWYPNFSLFYLESYINKKKQSNSGMNWTANWCANLVLLL